MLIFYGAALVTAALGALADRRSHRIPNRLTIWSGTAGIACGFILDGPGGLARSLGGLAFSCLYAAFWLLGALKAGDIKLYMAVGAWAGWKFSLYTMIGSFLTGGAAALLTVIRRRDGQNAARRLRIYMENLVLARKFYQAQPEKKQGHFCFGACILAGALAAFWKLSDF